MYVNTGQVYQLMFTHNSRKTTMLIINVNATGALATTTPPPT